MYLTTHRHTVQVTKEMQARTADGAGHSGCSGGIHRKITVQGQTRQNHETLSEKQLKQNGLRDVQGVEPLPSKCRTQVRILIPPIKRKKRSADVLMQMNELILVMVV
jgi:hypothetical protein